MRRSLTLEDRVLGHVDANLTPQEERDVRRFYNHINALLKGTKRRHRRHLTYIKKMLRKGKWPRDL